MTPLRLERGSSRHLAVRLIGWGALLVVLVSLPFFNQSYTVGQLTYVLAYAIAVLGLNLLVGYSGQISLGHGAFFAIGAYTAAVLIDKAGVPYLVAIPAAGLVTLVAGLVFAVPALRLRGPYLALVTLGLALAVPALIKRFEGLTGGTQGLTISAPSAPGWLGFLEDDQFLYLLTLVVAVALFVLAANLVRGQVGRALIALRDNEIAAETMGVNLARTKAATFGVSSAYAGVAGAMYAFALGIVAPEAFPLALSFGFLAAIVVGGLATVSGAVFGALFIVYVPVYAGDVNEALTGVIYGATLIIFIYLLPGGIAGLGRGLVRRVLVIEDRPPGTATRSPTATHTPAGGRLAGEG